MGGFFEYVIIFIVVFLVISIVISIVFIYEELKIYGEILFLKGKY